MKKKLSDSEDNLSEVLTLADAVGTAQVTLFSVAEEFLKIVKAPIIGGGFAMAHHGRIRATVDIDLIGIETIDPYVKAFERLGYKHEVLRIPIGLIHLLTRGNKGIDFIDLDHREFNTSIKSRAVAGTFMGKPVRFVSLEDLILLKMLAVKGRKNKKDEIDLHDLLSLSYDQKYVKTWIKKLRL